MLIALGKKELQEFLRKNENVEVICHFCRQKYIISLDKIRDLLNKLNN